MLKEAMNEMKRSESEVVLEITVKQCQVLDYY